MEERDLWSKECTYVRTYVRSRQLNRINSPLSAAFLAQKLPLFYYFMYSSNVNESLVQCQIKCLPSPV